MEKKKKKIITIKRPFSMWNHPPAWPLGVTLLLLLLTVGASSSVAGRSDLSAAQIRLVADRLRLNQCRSLVESLHSQDYELDHTPDGENEAQSISCFRLLDSWNRHRPANSTFHLLLVRLQELGHRDVADALSKEVYGETVLAVKTNFLSDPFRKTGPEVNLKEKSVLTEASNQSESQLHLRQTGSVLELVTFTLAMSLIMLLGAFICNRVTSRCTIKLPPRIFNAVTHIGGVDGSSESTQQLLPENV